MFHKDNCSPDSEKDSISCISTKLLQKIYKIIFGKSGKKLSKKQLHSKISKELGKQTECSKEACWMTLDMVKKKLTSQEKTMLKNSFRPLMPKEWDKNPKMWLNTLNIDNVMKQYQKKYKDFRYLGATPIDFDLQVEDKCVVSDLCSLDIETMYKQEKCKRIGIVFNTDGHKGSGKHWFSMYVDLCGKNMEQQPKIYYYDSAETKRIPKEIYRLIQTIQEQFKKMYSGKKTIDIVYNDRIHQKKNTECGIYSIHFLDHMVRNKSFFEYIHSDPSDEEMNRMRKKYFVKL